MTAGRSVVETVEVVRRELDRVYTAPGNPFRLGNSLGVSAPSDEIAAAWSDVDVSSDVISFWTAAGSATLFADLDDGQWGLELFDPPTSRERTEAERVRRPDDIASGDVVVGAFLGDLELVVVDADGVVRIALPLDPRSDWYRPASSFTGFLDRYVESTGHKFWESEFGVPDPGNAGGVVGADGVVADLRALDRALEQVVAAIPWAERSGNRVVWGSVEIADAEPAPPPGVAELFGWCERIDAADVDNGWFVHAPRPVDEHDGSVPHRIAGSGGCWPLGSDGGGGWLVVDDEGVVLLLRPGVLADNEYRPSSDDDVVSIAPTVAGFVAVLRDAAVAMADRSEPATATADWWRERLADIECEPASADEIDRIAADQAVTLPAAYAAFLRVAGRRCGELWLGSDTFVPALFGIREHAAELMRDASLELAPTDVVIGSHQGYEFLLLHGGGADPEVRRFAEGTPGTVVVATSFSSLVLDALGI